jgi:hypothetical protein
VRKGERRNGHGAGNPPPFAGVWILKMAVERGGRVQYEYETIADIFGHIGVWRLF